MAVARLKTSYASAGLDYAEAQVILEAVGPANESVSVSYQVLIENEAKLWPAWLSALPRGRRALRDALTADAGECFRRAGAFDNQPAVEVVAFLDRLANLARARVNLPLLESGRRAERLSFMHELANCAEMHGAPMVEWVALDDNSAGYDILSSRLVGGHVVPKLVEVKSCRGWPLRLIITRNEWDIACRHAEAYVVHFWDLNVERLHELSWADLQPHMPVDRGDARWDSATLNLERLHGF
ncbi:protein NO VEIN domain-containing protein [Hylemonella sp. W303a]|uniref:protein NO VEIN domain-containing protein n=1 Tax=Hylemonella sp. W303a TaxID=3389873 RepID=UPI00396B29C5